MIILKGYNPQSLDAYNEGGETFVVFHFETLQNTQDFYADLIDVNLKGAVQMVGTSVIISVDSLEAIQMT